MEDRDDRPKKKQKLFQYSLPAEMIENILNNCSCLITLESLACTCKQINGLVSNIFKKSITVQFKLFFMNRNSKEEITAKFIIKGNGDALKKSKKDIISPGSSKRRSKSTARKIKDRSEYDTLASKLLDIMNMTDTTKLNEKKAKEFDEDPLFTLSSYDEVLFAVTVNGHKLRYIAKQAHALLRLSEKKKKSIEEDPDFDKETREDWSTLDEAMIKRLKCALCVLEIRRQYIWNIKDSPKSSKYIEISFGNDEVDNAGWELKCYNNGDVTGKISDWSDQQWDFNDESDVETIQCRPSTVKPVFNKIKEFIRLYPTKSNPVAKKGDSDIIEKENSDEDKNNHEDINDNNDEEENKEDENSEPEEERRNRSATIVLNKQQYVYENMSPKRFEQLMDTLKPVTSLLSLDFEY